MTKIGEGILSWPRRERIDDRYGVVILLDKNLCTIPIEHTIKQGTIGELFVIVKEARQSMHIGDFFRGFYPTTPEVGERISLGTGLVFYERLGIGIEPTEERDIDWLDPKSLYRAHEQLVELHFEETKK